MPEIDGEFAKLLGVEDGDVSKIRASTENVEARSQTPSAGTYQRERDAGAAEVNKIEVPKGADPTEIGRLQQQTANDLAARGIDRARCSCRRSCSDSRQSVACGAGPDSGRIVKVTT